MIGGERLRIWDIKSFCDGVCKNRGLSDFSKVDEKGQILDIEYKLKGAVIKMKGFGVFGQDSFKIYLDVLMVFNFLIMLLIFAEISFSFLLLW